MAAARLAPIPIKHLRRLVSNLGEQVRAGLAWFFRRYAKELPPDRRQQYVDMEAQAQVERRGLWADAEPVAPWHWRARKVVPLRASLDAFPDCFDGSAAYRR